MPGSRRPGSLRAAAGAFLASAVVASLLFGAPSARAGEPLDTPPPAADPTAWSPAAAAAPRSAAPTPAATPAPTPAAIPPARVIASPVAAPAIVSHGPRDERVVALTFDDGWNAGTLRRIYRILLREHVPATFFVTGIYVQRAPSLWRHIAASGFGLANHSYLHRDARRLSARRMARDLALTREVVEATTGRPMLAAFRPPYGYRTPTTDRRAAAAGFPAIVLWDVSGADTAHRPTVASVVRHASAGRPGSIILLHAGPRVTPRALPQIIARYRARGFRFVSLEELLGISAVSPGPAAPHGAGPERDPGPRNLDQPGRSDGDTSSTAATAAARPGSEAGDASGSEPGVPAVGAELPAGAALPSRLVGAVPAAAASGLVDAPPPARDAAWARGADAPASVAVFTLAGLALLLALAAAAGRASRPPDDAPD